MHTPYLLNLDFLVRVLTNTSEFRFLTMYILEKYLRMLIMLFYYCNTKVVFVIMLTIINLLISTLELRTHTDS